MNDPFFVEAHIEAFVLLLKQIDRSFALLGIRISDLKLQQARIKGAKNSQVGSIAGINAGLLLNDSVEATVSTGKTTGNGDLGAAAGALAGVNYFGIQNSSSSGSVSGGENAIIGGLVGENSEGGFDGDVGTISMSFSTASVILNSGSCTGCSIGSTQNSAGGLAGANTTYIYACYATGAVTAGSLANVGGLVGFNVGGSEQFDYTLGQSYSIGTVSGGSGSSIGGAIGYAAPSSNLTYIYWDTTTSGIAGPSQGVGNISNDAGVTGLTTTQLQSGLPAGFSATFWSESPSINNGLPYGNCSRGCRQGYSCEG